MPVSTTPQRIGTAEASLTALNGPDVGSHYALTGRASIMGRHPDCDVVINVGAVSRHHAQIKQVGDNYMLEDMGSRNGTFLNDQPIEGQKLLFEGDKVRVCDTTYAFHVHLSTNQSEVDRPGLSTVLVDDGGLSPNIMGTVEVSSSHSSIQLSTSAEAKLAALLEINASLGKTLSLDKVLPQLLDSLFKIFIQADRGFIILESDSGQLVPRWTKLRRESQDDSLRISRTIVKHVMESREAILSADAASDERFDMSQSIANFQIRSMMCAPLVDSDGRALGVLQIDTIDQRSRFNQDDLELLASIASQAAIAIDNAQLHNHMLRQRELERDLQLAHTVQHSFLPQHPPEIEHYQFFNFYQPANKIGGDYFDYIELLDGRVALVVADVVGHGVAAALLMAQLSAHVRFALLSSSDAGEALTRLNRDLSKVMQSDRFITAVLAVLEPATGKIAIASAGHMPPLVCRTDGQVDEVGSEVNGFPLGIFDDVVYSQSTGTLGPGELLMLYTDGLSEAMNPDEELYGLDRIREKLSAIHGQLKGDCDAKVVGRHLLDDVARFAADRPAIDDMCLVCLSRSVDS